MLESLRDTCARWGWRLESAHVRPTHVHAVVAGEDERRKMLGALKANASRFVRQRLGEPEGVKRWAAGGSRKQLSTNKALLKAVDYVVFGQGGQMQVYTPDFGLGLSPDL